MVPVSFIPLLPLVRMTTVRKKNNIGILTLVDREGKFVDGLGEFSGRYIKDYKNQADYSDVNVDLSVMLKKEGQYVQGRKIRTQLSALLAHR
jgi:hypothetical protein